MSSSDELEQLERREAELATRVLPTVESDITRNLVSSMMGQFGPGGGMYDSVLDYKRAVDGPDFDEAAFRQRLAEDTANPDLAAEFARQLETIVGLATDNLASKARRLVEERLPRDDPDAELVYLLATVCLAYPRARTARARAFLDALAAQVPPAAAAKYARHCIAAGGEALSRDGYLREIGACFTCAPWLGEMVAAADRQVAERLGPAPESDEEDEEAAVNSEE